MNMFVSGAIILILGVAASIGIAMLTRHVKRRNQRRNLHK